MKTIYLIIALLTSMSTYAQSTFSTLDKSPLDISYYPVNYPVLKIQDKATEPLIARVIYSRPQRNGRTIFGDLIEYGKVWRLGANEATEIEFFKDIKLGNKKIKKGRYTLYAILQPDKWTMILNKDTDIWGAFKYDSLKDVARIDIPCTHQNESLEAFSIAFEKAGNNSANLVIGWDDVVARMPFSW